MPTTNQQPLDLDAIRHDLDALSPTWNGVRIADHAKELLAEVERLRAELAMWRDDVSAQWHAECIRLQGEVERLTREQLNADIAAGSQPDAGAR
jgi:hypothetical protein